MTVENHARVAQNVGSRLSQVSYLGSFIASRDAVHYGRVPVPLLFLADAHSKQGARYDPLRVVRTRQALFAQPVLEGLVVAGRGAGKTRRFYVKESIAASTLKLEDGKKENLQRRLYLAFKKSLAVFSARGSVPSCFRRCLSCRIRCKNSNKYGRY